MLVYRDCHVGNLSKCDRLLDRRTFAYTRLLDSSHCRSLSNFPQPSVLTGPAEPPHYSIPHENIGDTTNLTRLKTMNEVRAYSELFIYVRGTGCISGREWFVYRCGSLGQVYHNHRSLLNHTPTNLPVVGRQSSPFIGRNTSPTCGCYLRIVHTSKCDVKQSNILLTHTENACITEF